jgi:hypothetical protein
MPTTKTPFPVRSGPRRAPAKKRAAARKPALPKVLAVAPSKTTKAAKPAKPAKPVQPAQAEPKEAKQRVRLVRDSFTMPEPDFALIASLKVRALAGQREAKKSELLRAGLHALMALDSAALVSALGRLQPLKMGRPKRGH